MVTLFFGCGGGAWLINKIGVWRAFSAGLLCALGSLSSGDHFCSYYDRRYAIRFNR